MLRIANILVKNAAGQNLLQFRDNNPGIPMPLVWTLWGGALENEETHLEAAIRELSEELEIHGQPTDFRHITTYQREDGSKEFAFFQYLPPIEWNEFKVNEGAGAGYFWQNDIPQLQSTLNLKELYKLTPEVFA